MNSDKAFWYLVLFGGILFLLDNCTDGIIDNYKKVKTFSCPPVSSK